MTAQADGPVILHASAVAFGDAGLLITGRSGAGKSSLAIELLGIGADLVADDCVVLTMRDGGLLMSAPETTSGLVEARGIGLLRSDFVCAWARAVVDLDHIETRRLPDPRETVIAGVPLPLIRKVESAAFPSMLRLVLKGGRVDDR